MFGNLFNKSSFGLDIGDDSVKFIELVNTKNGIRVGRYGARTIPSGVVEEGKIKDPKKLEEFLLSLKKDFGFKSVRISLPTEDAQNIKDYLSIFKKSSIKVKSFVPQNQALSRSVIKKGDLGTYLVVHFDKKHSNIFIISNGVVIPCAALEFGGDVVTEMIGKKFGISFEEAEKMKRKYGLSRNPQNKEMFQVILSAVSFLRDQVAKHFLYWHTRKNEEENRPSIKKIILCGTESSLIGFSEYLSVSLRNEVEMAKLWVNTLDTEKYIPEISLEQSLAFAAAFGVALKDF